MEVGERAKWPSKRPGRSRSSIPSLSTTWAPDSCPTLHAPRENVTGVSMMAPDLIGKQFEVLREVLPEVSRVAVLWNPANPSSASQLREAELAARTLRLRLQSLEARSPQEIDTAFAAMTSARAGALVVLLDAILVNQRRQIADLAEKRRLPAVYAVRNTWRPAVSSAMAQILLSWSGMRRPSWTRSSEAQSQPIFPSSSQANSSSSSTSRPPRRSASRSRKRCCCARIRSSNSPCWTNAMMVNVREASVTDHAFLECMFVKAALWDPGLGDIAVAKYETRDCPIYKAGPRLYDRGLANGEGRVSTSRTLSAS